MNSGRQYLFNAFVKMLPFLALLSCSTSVDPTNPYDPAAPEVIQAKGFVVGRVTLEEADDYSGVLVALEGVSGTALTDANGKFTLNDIRGGTYTLSLTKEGYKDYKMSEVKVSQGKETDVGIIPVNMARGVVKGQVNLLGATDSGGAAVTLKTVSPQGLSETVLKSGLNAASRSLSAISSTDGSWEVQSVPAGQYYLILAKDSYQAMCAGLVTIIKDGEEKSVGVVELVGTSALVTFADSSGVPLPPYSDNGVLKYFTNSRSLKARFTAGGVIQLRTGWSVAEIDAAQWDSFVVEKDIVIAASEQDGAKTFYFDIKDQCGMESRHTASLTLDTTPPNVALLDVDSILGTNGNKYINNQSGQATVRLTAEDATSGIEGYRLTVDKEIVDEPFVPVPSTGSIVIGLGNDDRQYILRAEYRDRAGNKTAATPLEVRLDRQEPTGSVVVKGVNSDPTGDWISSTELDLSITGLDPEGTDQTPGSGVARMKIWNSPGSEPADWLSFANDTRWSISSGDTIKVVNLKLQDSVGNTSTVQMTTSFNLYTSGPVSGIATLEGETDFTGVLVSVSGHTPTVLTGSTGEFTLTGVSQGVWDITLSKTGYKTTVLRSIEIKPKTGTSLGSLQLTKSRGYITGSVILESSETNAGVAITLSPGGYAGFSDISGSFRIDGIPVGTYSVTAGKEGYSSSTLTGKLIVEDMGTVVTFPALQKISSTFVLLDDSTDNPNPTTYSKKTAVKPQITPPTYTSVCVAENCTESTCFDTWCGSYPLHFGALSVYSTITLTVANGSKTVYADFRDAGGVRVALMSAATILDTVSPEIDYVQLNGGATYINIANYSSNVTLTMAAQDVTSGVYQYAYCFGDTTCLDTPSWSSIVSGITMAYSPTGDGAKNIHVMFRDRAGNKTSALDTKASATITVDTSRPSSTGIAIQADATESLIKYVRNRTVSIVITKGTASGVKLANDVKNFDFADYRTISGTDPVSWDLSSGDGTKTVYAQFFNSAGNPTDPSTDILDTVVLKTLPPSAPAISIAQGALTNQSTVTANLSATGAKDYAVCVNTAFTEAECAWNTYSPGQTKAVDLPPGDGIKAVYAKFRDLVLNETQLVMTTIQLDQTAPQNGSITISQKPSKDRVVDLALFAIGATKMCIYGTDIDSPCDPATSPSGWISYSTSKVATLIGDEGLKTIKVKYADEAGNVSPADPDVISDTTHLDQTAPSPGTPALTITGKIKDASDVEISDTVLTYKSNVSLLIQATDNYSSNISIALSNAEVPCATATYTPVTFVSGATTIDSYMLQSGTGTKTVYVCFKDEAGNVATPASSGVIYLDETPPVNAKFSINSGAQYTNLLGASLTGISFTDDYDGQTYMKFSNCLDFGTGTDCNTTAWIAKAGTYSWTLKSGDDGTRTVYMKTRDFAGNEGSIVDASLIYKVTPPSGGLVSITQGAATKNTSVDLILYANGATRMCIYGNINDPCDPSSATSGWITYSTAKNVTLSSGQVSKTVKVKFGDEANNKSDEATAVTFLDTTAPVPGSPAVLITGYIFNDVESTLLSYRSDVQLTLQATDNYSSTFGVAISNAPISCDSATYNDYTFTDSTVNISSYMIQSGTGTREVYVCFRDLAGNYTSGTSSDSIYLDQTPPKNVTFNINDGAIYTSGTAVSLNSISAQDDCSEIFCGMYMMFSNCADFAATGCDTTTWITLASTYSWTLTSGADAIRKVYLKTRDTAGNESAIAYSSITLDTAEPVISSATVTPDPTKETQVTLSINASDATRMCVYGDIDTQCSPASETSTWEPYRTDKIVTLTTGDEVKSISILCADEGGNTSDAGVATVTLDTVAPYSPDFSINGGQPYTRNQSVTLSNVTAFGGPHYYFVEGDVYNADPSSFKWLVPDAGFPTQISVILDNEGGNYEGRREVRVKFKDQAGNESYPAISTIIYDPSNPSSSSMSLNVYEAGSSDTTSRYTRTRAVDLAIGAQDSLSGIAKMQISRCSDFDGGVLTCANNACGDKLCPAGVCCTIEAPYYDTYPDYKVMGTDAGIKNVYMRVQNGAMALDPARPWSDGGMNYIYLDNRAPIIDSISITDPSSGYTNTGIITIDMTASDPDGTDFYVKNVKFAESPPGYDSYSWETFDVSQTMTKKFFLSSGESEKTINVKVKDASGRESADSTLTVTYDKTPPQVLSFSAEPYNKVRNISFSINAVDNYTATDSLRLCGITNILTSNRCSSYCGKDCSNAVYWEDYESTKTWQVAATERKYTVGVCACDLAGNITESPTTTEVIYDITPPPTPTLGTPVPSSSAVTLNWNAVTDPGTSGNISGLDYYEVQYGTDQAFGAYNTQQSTTTTITIGNLALHTTYYFRIKAVDKAGNSSDPSATPKSAVAGWKKTTLDQKPYYTTSSGAGNFKPFFFDDKIWLASSAGANKLYINYCDSSLDDCTSTSSWHNSTITAPGNVLTRTYFPIVRAGDYLFIGAVGTISASDYAYVLKCNYTTSDCTDGTQWDYYSISGASTPVYNHISLVSNGGNMLALTWGTATELKVSVCYLTKNDCVTSGWSTPTTLPYSIAADAASTPPAAFLDDKFLYLFYRDQNKALHLASCHLNSGCTIFTGVVGKGYNFVLDTPDSGEESGINISTYHVDENRHVTWDRYKKDSIDQKYYHERMIASCNTTSEDCKISSGSWSKSTTPLFKTLYKIDTADLSMAGNLLKIVWRDPLSAIIYEKTCPYAMDLADCTLASNWSNPAQIDTGYTDGTPMLSFAGPNPVIAIRDALDMLRVFHPKIPAPAKFSAGPGVSSISSSWSQIPFIDGYTNYYGPDGGVEANSVYLPDPGRTTNVVSLADYETYLSRLDPMLSGEVGESTPIYQMRPFAEFAIPNPLKKYESAAVMCMDANSSRIAVAYGTSGNPAKLYVGYCNFGASGDYGYQCRQSGNWTWRTIYSYADSIPESCSLAMDNSRIIVSHTFTYSNSVRYREVNFCDKLDNGTGCGSASDWEFNWINLDSKYGATTVSDGKIALNNGILAMMFKNTSNNYYHFKICDLTKTVSGECAPGHATLPNCCAYTSSPSAYNYWIYSDIDTSYTYADSTNDHYDITTKDVVDDGWVLTSQAVQLPTPGIRTCYCRYNITGPFLPGKCLPPSGGGNLECTWALKNKSVSQLKFSIGRDGTYYPGLFWRDDPNNRMMFSYCADNIDGYSYTYCKDYTGSTGGTWMHTPLADVARASSGDKFNVESNDKTYYLSYMNRGTLYLASAERSKIPLFDGRQWGTVPVTFSPNLLGASSNSTTLKLISFSGTKYVYMIYAVEDLSDPLNPVVTAKVLLRGQMERY